MTFRIFFLLKNGGWISTLSTPPVSAPAIKIYIKPNRIDVVSYPGPDPSLKPEDFFEENEVPYVPSRNRRIAEFLRERKLAEGRFTGVRAMYRSMKSNNNPKPIFNFTHTYFSVQLPGHPKGN